MTPGTRLGQYAILAPLGAGGMGEVYRARDSKLNRDVAIKVLPEVFAADAERLVRFTREAQTLAALNHPNILTVHDVGSGEGHPYLVCELLEGETLRERLDRGPLTPERAVGLAVQAARGLAAAHAKGVVHRDLKPENIFLTRDGRAKILDFGIAKLVQPDGQTIDQLKTAPETAMGTVIGTAAYMSPEQVAGRAVDQRSDLFSFGVVLYEMLAGRRPFTGNSAIETMTAVLHADPPQISTTDRVVPPALSRIVTRCLEKTPDERFQSAHDLAFALDPAIPTGHLEPVADVRTPVATRRVGWWWLLATAAGGAALGWSVHTPAPVSDAPTFSRVVKLVATDAIESSPVLSPDGKWLAYLSDEGGRQNVWVRFLSGGSPINLTAGAPDLFVSPTREIGGLDISPDGTQIVFAASAVPNALANQQFSYVVPAPLGGTPRRFLERGLGARWSPDGSRVVSVIPGGSAGDALGVSDSSGGNQRVVLPVAGGLHTHWPAWSADGRFIYFTRSATSANSEPTEIARIPANGGVEEPVVVTSRRAVFPYASRDGKGLLYGANPDTVDLALWWKPRSGSPVRVSTGVGEYAEARLSSDGTRMVATVYELKRSLALLPIAGTAVRPQRLTGGFTGDMDPSVSPRGDRLAFSSTRTGERTIWISHLDGSDARQVTAGTAFDERPQWSPDGSTIAFVSSREGQRGIWTVPAEGGPPRRVVLADALGTITWSPGGREIVYAAPAGAAPALFRVGLDGTNPARLPTPTAATAPQWSAASNQVAYIASVLATATAPGRTWAAMLGPSGTPIDRPREPVLGNGMVAWSPDGRFLAGISIPGVNYASVWVIPVEGHEPPRRVIEFVGDERPRGVAWMPDGQHLVIGLQERTADIVLFDGGK